MITLNSSVRAKPWLAVLLFSSLAAACGGGGGGFSTGPVFVAPADAVAPGAACSLSGVNIPTVTVSSPSNGNQFASTSTYAVTNGGKQISATFSLPMNGSSINASSVVLAPAGGAVLGATSLSYNSATQVASLTTSSALQANTSYTATILGSVKSAAGTALGCPYAWTFKTAAVANTQPPQAQLGTAVRFGNFGGTAGMTNTGNLTVITGSNGSTADIGTTATGTSSITGFHDSNDTYTETPGVNEGLVTGRILSCAASTTGPSAVGASAQSCAAANQAKQDTESAYLALQNLPMGANPGANLASLTLAPGVYTAPAGSFKIEGGNLTLDAQGDTDAVWVFQMASTLTVGGPGASAPQSVILTGGAQAKNVSWQVGSNAIINAGGGGTMVGNIVSRAGTTFSTAGQTTISRLNGRVLSLGASVTMVNTVITVPAP